MWDYRKHLAVCPHCGKEALDHMRECPSCGGILSPETRGGWPEEKVKAVRRALNIAGFVVAAALLLWRVLSR